MAFAVPFIAAGFTAIGVGAATATILAQGVLIAVGLGLSLLSTMLFRPAQPKPSDGQTLIRQSTAPRQRSYGRVKVAGSYMFANTQTGVLHRVFAMGSGEIDEVEEHWIDDTLVTVELVGNTVTTPKYNVGGSSKVRLEWELGSAAGYQFLLLEAAFPGVWTSDHLGKGIPKAYMLMHQVKAEQINDMFPRLADTLYRQVQRGALVPSVSGGVIGAASWSDNPARCILDFMIHADGFRIPQAQIAAAIDYWEDAIAICDEAIPLNAGGTEPRYRLWNTYRFDERPADVLARFLQCCDGQVFPTPNGGIGIRVGKWETPAVTIDDDAILAFSEVRRGADILATANTIRARYTSPDHDYQETDADPWIDAGDVADRGEFVADFEFYCSPSHTQTRRLMKIAAARLNPDWAGTMVCNLRGLMLMGERFFIINCAELGLNITAELVKLDQIFEGNTITGVQVEWRSANEAAYDWDETTEEGEAPPLPPPIVPERDIPVPGGFGVAPFEVSAILTWSTPPEDYLLVEVRYKRTADVDWLPWGVSDGVDGVVVGPLVEGEEYEFQIRHRSDTTDRVSDWTASETLTISVHDEIGAGSGNVIGAGGANTIGAGF
jgi:hypothetical protein